MDSSSIVYGFVSFLVIAIVLLRLFVIPWADQDTRKRAIEKNMRQQLKDAEYEQQAARKILRENGIKG